MKIWEKQDISEAVMRSLEITAKLVHDDIMTLMTGISNVSEWCKTDACWNRLQNRTKELKSLLPAQFIEELMSKEEIMHEEKSAEKTQKIVSGIEAQTKVTARSAHGHSCWLKDRKNAFSPLKRWNIIQFATRIPDKLPSEKQSAVLLKVLKKAAGIRLPA